MQEEKPNPNPTGLVIIAPHKVPSRKVELTDLERIKELYFPLQLFMVSMEKAKVHKDVFAIAHQQIEEKDPLRFFVINADNQQIIKGNVNWDLPDYLIINPEIINHTNVPVLKSEGCLSFLGYPNNEVERYNKIEVKYWVINHEGDKLVEHTSHFDGKMAQICQHEIDHFNCQYIWQEMVKK